MTGMLHCIESIAAVRRILEKGRDGTPVPSPSLGVSSLDLGRRGNAVRGLFIFRGGKAKGFVPWKA